MENKKLVICGNGFDLCHGLKTNYFSYKEYLSNTHPKLLAELETVCNSLNFSMTESDFWYDIEKSLSDIYNNTFLYYDENFMDRLTSVTFQFTGGVFLDWLFHVYNQGKESIKICDEFSEIMSNSLFINFNYTQTLEDIYSVNKEDILYIHGNIESVVNKQLNFGNYS